MSAREIPLSVKRKQAEASDPAVAVFVAANAGSGKTFVLAQRVIRLMLDGGSGGVDPAKILCITFTKTAAANMAARVYDTLRNWIALDDAGLDHALAELGIAGIDPAKRARARRLFAAALETPGGLKVETIHAFCARMLQRFPFEANVAARFSVVEERVQDDLLARATLDTILVAAGGPETPLGRALRCVVACAGDSTLMALVREATMKRAKLVDWITAAGGLDNALAQLASTLGIAAEDDVAAAEKEIVEGPLLPVKFWERAATVLRSGSSQDVARADQILAALAALGEARVENYLCVFLNKKKEPRQDLITCGLAGRHPQLRDTLFAEQARLAPLIERRNAIKCRDRTAALAAIALEVIKRYSAEKERRGLLDYDDLIDKAYALLSEVDPGWVHFKLDLGLDHVLVDEAQDISEKQWGILKRLTADYAAGAGARGLLPRTVFAVGDEKQSIYSFQGAAPLEYDRARRHFAKNFASVEVAWRAVRFDHSFRSGPDVLGAVDEVFRPAELLRSISCGDDAKLTHLALPDAAPGVVEIWPLIEADPAPDVEPWNAPFDAVAETRPEVKLAAKIAAAVRSLLNAGTPVGRNGERRPMREGDIMVLVRRRGVLFEAIIRALKSAGIAVAGADRLKLAEHIAVADLLALADAMLLPDDDLAVAVALKSPLLGFDDDQLFALAYGRRSSLRDALAARASTDANCAAADALLRRADAKARETPFAFFAWLLGPEQGRRKIYARLGLEAADALDEFLELALAYERSHTASLQGFLAFLRAAPTIVKRDMEIARDEVRVMTVHGAKGLEAPVVVLADTTTPPQGSHPPRLIDVAPARAVAGAPGMLVWAGRKEDDVPALAAARAAALAENTNEYRRLLYVAMTRAAERLIVCGHEGKIKRRSGCWYDLVLDGLKDKPEFTQEGEGEAARWRYRKSLPRIETAPLARTPLPIAEPEPAWLRSLAVPQLRPRALTPSGGHGSEAAIPNAPPRARTRSIAVSATREDMARALARGTIIHRLLQSLPDIDPARRAAAARLYLAQAGAGFLPQEQDHFVAEALAVFDTPAFAPLFGPGSRAEVPIIGRLRRPCAPGLPAEPDMIVSGQIDRLIVTPDAVLIADFKTERAPPRRLEDVPPGYLQQLSLYRAVLARIHPDRPIRAALVWTELPLLMEIPAPVLDHKLRSLIDAQE